MAIFYFVAILKRKWLNIKSRWYEKILSLLYHEKGDRLINYLLIFPFTEKSQSKLKKGQSKI